MSVTAVAPLAVERRGEARRGKASRLLGSFRIRGDQVPASTHAERNRNPIEAAEATARHLLAQAWGWN